MKTYLLMSWVDGHELIFDLVVARSAAKAKAELLRVRGPSARALHPCFSVTAFAKMVANWDAETQEEVREYWRATCKSYGKEPA